MAALPRGRPLGLAGLDAVGVSPQLAAKHVRAGWLQRLGQGTYAFVNDFLEANAHQAKQILNKREKLSHKWKLLCCIIFPILTPLWSVNGKETCKMRTQIG